MDELDEKLNFLEENTGIGVNFCTVFLKKILQLASDSQLQQKNKTIKTVTTENRSTYTKVETKINMRLKIVCLKKQIAISKDVTRNSN